MMPMIRYFAVAVACTACCASALALESSYYSASSRLSKGHWVRVHVTAEGIQQVTYDQLREWGFDDPAKVRVYGLGGTYLNGHTFNTSVPDDVQPTLSMHTDDCRVLFYGDTDRRYSLDPSASATSVPYTVSQNYYSLGSYYLLTDSDAGGTLPLSAPYNDTVDPDMTMTTHSCVNVVEEDLTNPGTGGAVFHGKQYKALDKDTYTMDIRDFAGTNPQSASLTVQMAGHEAETWGNYVITLTGPEELNASTLSNIIIGSQGTTAFRYYNGRGIVNFGPDPEGRYNTVPDGQYTFSISCPSSTRLDYLALERIGMVYPRHNRLSDYGELIMQIPSANAGYNLAVLDAPAGSRVWNVTDPRAVYEHTSFYEGVAARILRITFNRSYPVAGTTPGRLVAFDPKATHHSVEFAGQVANQDIHGAQTPDLVIVTTDELLPEAEELAQIHRQLQGLDVLVATQQQVFNEFGSGTPHAHAVRRMAKMFYDRDPRKFKNLLMYGRTSWDNRGITTVPGTDNLICYEVEPTVNDTYAVRHTSLNFCSDNYFGMLDDAFVHRTMYSERVRIGVGRLPLEKSVAGQINAKIRRYLLNPPTAEDHGQVLMISDDGDSNRHLSQSEEVAASMQHYKPWLTFTRAHQLIYPRGRDYNKQIISLIQGAMIQGTGYFSYTGHGRPDSFTAEGIWSQSLINSTPNTVLPIAMMATCDTYNLDRTEPGIAETMVLHPTGGAFAVIAAARSVYLDYNQAMNLAVAAEYARIAAPKSVGSLYAAAHNATIDNNTSRTTDRYLNCMCYNLCGDPALPVYAPTRKVVVSKVNNVTVYGPNAYDGDPLHLHPYKPLEFEGYVLDENGEPDASFDGEATVNVYEIPHVVNTIVMTTQDKNQSVQLDENRLVSTTVKVSGGKYSGSIILPFGTYFGGKNRMVITAHSDKLQAAGMFDNLSLQDEEATAVESDLLDITEMYIDDQQFVPGGEVPSDFTVYATLNLKEAGLSVGSSLGDGTRLLLDGTRALPGALNAVTINTDGTATFCLPVSGIADGRHTVTLSVADNLRQRVQRSLAFTVVNRSASARLVTESDYARDKFVLDLETSLTDNLQTRLVIVDRNDNTVFSAENVSLPFTWNLMDKAGNDLPDGRYEAFMLVRSGNRYADTPRASVVIIRH